LQKWLNKYRNHIAPFRCPEVCARSAAIRDQLNTSANINYRIQRGDNSRQRETEIEFVVDELFPPASVVVTECQKFPVASKQTNRILIS